ncbi:hypothetical protein SESBI_18211 [Sesbania bispinosa]|nr:hypothetical protein SESBI_32375 [Sesbania bispinosa]KAJ1415256.1 hypothetical protein SESBI_18211 [Sesbania bispinosa]
MAPLQRRWLEDNVAALDEEDRGICRGSTAFGKCGACKRKWRGRKSRRCNGGGSSTTSRRLTRKTEGFAEALPPSGRCGFATTEQYFFMLTVSLSFH